MNPVLIVGFILVLVCGLICYIFIRQTVAKKQQHKKRVHRALDKRTGDLMSLLEAFPANYLPRDLRGLIYRCLVDTYQQLCQLAPDKPQYLQELNAHSATMETIAREAEQATRLVMSNPQQIAEVQKNLTVLNRFLNTLYKRGSISGNQRSHYHNLIKKLVAQLGIDNYIIAGKNAIQIKNPRLAIQKYRLAKGILTKEGVLCQHKEQLAKLDSIIAKLEEQIQQAKEAEKTKTQPADEPAEQQDGWDQFEEEAGWKKKNVYD